LHVEDGFGPEERDRQLPRRVWTRRVCLAGRNVVVPSRTLERIALGVWRLAPRLVAYIPNGIDLARFAAAPERHGGLVIGTVATLRAEKNLSRLLRAFAILDAGFGARLVPVRLVIVGDGPERGTLEALAGSLGIAGQVEFAGHQPDPSRFYGGFDVFALSSDTEQMPLSVLEAMAAGLPVVATEVGDVRAMIAPANARWLCGRDDGALAAVLADALGDAVARGEIGAANRRKAEQDYAQEKMFSAYAALFDGAPIPAAAPRSAADSRR
jgi:glycosyltransferase involved in cell wall biosynthesis